MCQVACPYVLWMAVLFLYLGTLVLTSMVDEPPPSFVLPRLLFMVTVAILVERRAGYPSILKKPSSFAYETMLTILVCNLALAFVWDQVEKIVYFILIPVSAIVEAVTGLALRCENCQSIDTLQFIVTTAIAALLLFWALKSLVSFPLIHKSVTRCILNKTREVKFWSRVEVRFINETNHSPEGTTEEQLKASTEEGTNPVVQTNSFKLPTLD